MVYRKSDQEDITSLRGTIANLEKENAKLKHKLSFGQRLKVLPSYLSFITAPFRWCYWLIREAWLIVLIILFVAVSIVGIQYGVKSCFAQKRVTEAKNKTIKLATVTAIVHWQQQRNIIGAYQCAWYTKRNSNALRDVSACTIHWQHKNGKVVVIKLMCHHKQNTCYCASKSCENIPVKNK